MLRLKAILQLHRLRQADLARVLGYSRPTVAQWINHSIWPKTVDRPEIEHTTLTWLSSYGITATKEIFEEEKEENKLAAQRSSARQPENHNDDDEEVLEVMLLRKQTLTPQARQVFGLVRDPFGEPRGSDELFVSPDIRYVREVLYQGAKFGVFVAVVGESGSGKSTIRKDLHERIKADQLPVVIIEPYVLGMEDDDFKGKTLKASQIGEAILAAVAPGVKPFRGQEARFRQIHSALKESARMGNRHVLIIEEAHSLPIPTLKHLKRFFELEDGFEKLLSIVLIGQTELGIKLDERNPAVREVVQRCEVVRLGPLNEYLQPYLEHRFRLVGKPLAEVMGDDAVQALRNKLTGSSAKDTYSVLYPLAVHNVMTAALNAAAAIGARRIDPAMILEV